MAKNDYFIIAYRILAYLYACLKDGATPQKEYYSFEKLDIPKTYWNYVIENLYREGYLEGVIIVRELCDLEGIKIQSNFMITPKGIEFLLENSVMGKAKEFLETLKETVPWL